MLKRVLMALLVGALINMGLGATRLLLSNKVVKVGDTIIFKQDVERYAGLFDLSYDEAVEALIEEELLYIGAKIYIEEPEDEEIEKKLKEDRKFFAYQAGKESLTDDEFTNLLLTKNLTMRTYKSYLKKRIWIDRYLEKIYRERVISNYFPTDIEIAEVLSRHSEIAEEKESVALSMIYFSFYDSQGGYKDSDMQKALEKRAKECLNRLRGGEAWDELARRYSDGLIGANAELPGYVGVLRLDDSRLEEKFSPEIIKALKEGERGLIDRIFGTKHGYYIFKIESKIDPRKLSEEAARMKAEDYLIREHKKALRLKAREAEIKEIRKEIEVVVYSSR